MPSKFRYSLVAFQSFLLAINCCAFDCEPSRELQESLGPSGPEIPKKSEKSLPGPPAPGSQKVWKKSRKSPEQTFSRLFPDFSDIFETFSRLFRAPGPEAPGDLFQTFWGFRARRARETPVARGRVRKLLTESN